MKTKFTGKNLAVFKKNMYNLLMGSGFEGFIDGTGAGKQPEQLNEDQLSALSQATKLSYSKETKNYRKRLGFALTAISMNCDEHHHNMCSRFDTVKEIFDHFDKLYLPQLMDNKNERGAGIATMDLQYSKISRVQSQ